MAKALQLLRSTGFQVKNVLGMSCYFSSKCYWNRKESLSTLFQSGAKSDLPIAKLNSQNKWLDLKFEDEKQSKKYPYVWLRDNCRCSECYHEVSSQRLIQFSELDIDVDVKNMHLDNDGTVVIDWSDGHKGIYPLSFLEGEEFPAFSDPLRKLKQELWGSELQGAIPTFQFDDIIKNDEALFGWLTALHEKGVALIQDAGTQMGKVLKIGNRVAYLRKTTYGDIYHVMAKSDSTTIVYTGTAIDFHTDLCAMNHPPGMQMLHCIKQAAVGGTNKLVDMFKVVGDLRIEEPEVYNILKTTLFEFTDIGKDVSDYHFRSSKPAFTYDYEGRLCQVSIHFARHHSMNVPAEQVYDVYRALKVFFNFLYRKENIITHRLSEGEIICMDNRRLCHGRSKYEIDPSIKTVQRHLEGGYIDWDELNSFYRVLLYRQNKN